VIPRGRPIHPFLAEIAQLDTAATEANGGYDPDFKTLKTSYPQGVRTSSRRELPPIKVRCQVEPTITEDQRQTEAGNSPATMITLCFHYRDLEKMQLVDADGNPKIHTDDRLVAIYEMNGKLVQKLPPHVYARRPDLGSGWLRNKRNILLVTFENRAQGLTG